MKAVIMFHPFISRYEAGLNRKATQWEFHTVFSIEALENRTQIPWFIIMFHIKIGVLGVHHSWTNPKNRMQHLAHCHSAKSTAQALRKRLGKGRLPRSRLMVDGSEHVDHQAS